MSGTNPLTLRVIVSNPSAFDILDVNETTRRQHSIHSKRDSGMAGSDFITLH